MELERIPVQEGSVSKWYSREIDEFDVICGQKSKRAKFAILSGGRDQYCLSPVTYNDTSESVACSMYVMCALRI